MTISLAFDTPPLNFQLPAIKPANREAESPLLTEEEADQLLSTLVHCRWSRLACQDPDPLGMLFNDRGKQWTMGWEPQQQALLLFVWELNSWQNKPEWTLYRNGKLIFKASENISAQRRQWLTQLLEGPQPPFIEAPEFLTRLSDFSFSEAQRRQAAIQLQQTVAVLPEITIPLRAALLDVLDADLGNPDWPTLEVLKLHRLAHKNILVALLRQWVQQELLTDPSETAQLDRALSQLQQDYLTQSKQVQALFLPAYQQAYLEFRTLITNGLWRVQIRQNGKRMSV